MPIVTATVLTNNGIQVVILPTEACFPDTAKKVIVRIHGCERIITPLDNIWDHFFLNGPLVSEDFMDECGEQK